MEVTEHDRVCSPGGHRLGRPTTRRLSRAVTWALIYALLQYDFFVLYPINPATLAKYRQAFSTAHGKDDPTDADYLLDLLQFHRDRLRPWHPDDQKTRTLRLLVEQRRRLTGDRTRISNRLTALLKGYFPQVLDWFEDIRTRLVCDFLEPWPQLSVLQQARPATVDKFLRSHHSIDRCRKKRIGSRVQNTARPSVQTEKLSRQGTGS